MDRRKFMNTSVAVGAAAMGMTAVAQAAEEKPLTILGIACSPRQGTTTATSVKVALDAAAELHANIKTELIDLGGLTFSGWNGTGKSNVIEALTVIFRDLIYTSKKDKGAFRPPFSYRL